MIHTPLLPNRTLRYSTLANVVSEIIKRLNINIPLNIVQFNSLNYLLCKVSTLYCEFLIIVLLCRELVCKGPVIHQHGFLDLMSKLKWKQAKRGFLKQLNPDSTILVAKTIYSLGIILKVIFSIQILCRAIYILLT